MQGSTQHTSESGASVDMHSSEFSLSPETVLCTLIYLSHRILRYLFFDVWFVSDIFMR